VYKGKDILPFQIPTLGFKLMLYAHATTRLYIPLWLFNIVLVGLTLLSYI
jgi:hypothetical protein